MKKQKIDQAFLMGLGFEEAGVMELPDWYNIFETGSQITEANSFVYKRIRLTVYVHLSPKGPFGEVFCSDDPSNRRIYFHLFFAIRNRDDLASSISQLHDIANEAIKQEQKLASNGVYIKS